MGEIFGMKVDLELVVKNLKQVQKQVGDSMKNVPGGISQGILGGAGGGAGGGFGQFLGKATLAIGAIMVIGKGVGKIVGKLADASPYFKGILSVLNRSMMIFFRPFGDFLAALLKPLALVLMKAAVGWLKLTKKEAARTEGIGPIDIQEALGQAFRIRQGLPDEIGQEILDNIAAGSQTFMALPEEMKDKFFGWLLENADQIKLMPKDVRTNILSWIGENKAALVGMTKEVATAFKTDLLSPEGEQLLKGVVGSFAYQLKQHLNDPQGTNDLKGVFTWVANKIKSIAIDGYGGDTDLKPISEFKNIDTAQEVLDMIDKQASEFQKRTGNGVDL